MERLTPMGWAKWVLMGDPYTRVPDTLMGLAERIAQAINQAVGVERERVIQEQAAKKAEISTAESR